MAKKKRIWAYTGSMISPIAKYIISLKVTLNVNDYRGSGIAEYYTILLEIYFKKQ